MKYNSHEENPIGESGQGVNFAITIWELSVGRPLAHNCRTEPDNEGQTIEKHVDTVTQQSERASQKTVR